MPKRHLLRKKSRSRRSSTSAQSNRTRPKNQRTAQKKRGRKSSAAKPSQPTRTSPRLALGKTVIADLLGDPSLSFSAAARKWKVDRRWLREHFGSELQKDSSGRIRAKVRNRRHRTLYKPTASPGESIPVVTKSKRERHLLGTWIPARIFSHTRGFAVLRCRLCRRHPRGPTSPASEALAGAGRARGHCGVITVTDAALHNPLNSRRSLSS